MLSIVKPFLKKTSKKKTTYYIDRFHDRVILFEGNQLILKKWSGPTGKFSY